MKTYARYKKLVVAYWQALSDNNLTESEKQKDRRAFIKFYNNFIYFLYFIFAVFSSVSLYFFTTRVIF